MRCAGPINVRRHQRGNGGAVDPARQENAQRNICHTMSRNRLRQRMTKFFNQLCRRMA